MASTQRGGDGGGPLAPACGDYNFVIGTRAVVATKIVKAVVVKITLSYVGTKGSYMHFTHASLRGIVYVAKTAVANPGDITVTVEAKTLAPVTTVRTVDPVVLQARLAKLAAQTAATTAKLAAVQGSVPSKRRASKGKLVAKLAPVAPAVEPVAPAVE